MTTSADVPTDRRPIVHALTPAGTPVVLQPDIGAALAGFALAVPAGRGVDPDGRTGLAHMVEHLVLKQRRPEADPLPFVLNAFTTRDLTLYETVCAPEQSAAAVHHLLSILSGMPQVSEAELDTERRIIDVEAGGVGGPLDRTDSAIGVHRDRATITPADLTAFHTVHYRPERAVLAVAGAVDHEALTSALGLRPRDRGRSGDRTAQRPRTIPAGPPLRPVHPIEGSGRTTIRFSAPAATSPDYAVAAAVCVGLTGGGPHHFDLAAATPAQSGLLHNPGKVAYQGCLHPGRLASTMVLTLHRPAGSAAAPRPRLDPVAAKAEAVGAIALLREDPLLAARAEAGWALYRPDGLDGLEHAVEAASPDAVSSCADEVFACV